MLVLLLIVTGATKHTQSSFIYSKLAMETLEKGVKYAQRLHQRH